MNRSSLLLLLLSLVLPGCLAWSTGPIARGDDLALRGPGEPTLAQRPTGEVRRLPPPIDDSAVAPNVMPEDVTRYGGNQTRNAPAEFAEDPLEKFRDGWGPAYGLRFDTGDGVAVRRGFWTPQAFVPLLDRTDEQFLFADLRASFTEDHLLATNAGLGYRRELLGWGRTVGVYVYYDYRDAQQHGFQQVSPGAELLGDDWILRGNVYLPQVGDAQKSLPNQFAGNYLYVDRWQVALPGQDLELGIPCHTAFDLRLFGGGYHFQGPNVPEIWGWRLRAENQWNDVASTSVAVQHDDSFGTSVNAWASLRFPGSRSRRARAERLSHGSHFYEPVQRFPNVVVRTNPGAPAVSPRTGRPLVFLHVAGGGQSDGSFENPYGTLAEALSDPRYAAGQADVIYVRQNPAARTDPATALVHEGDVQLVNGTQLLSNGPVQYVATSAGMELLPLSGADLTLARLPLIHGRVTLGDDTVLSGFRVAAEDATAAVRGTAVSGVNVNHNVISNTLGDGVRLTGVFGAADVARNAITGFGVNAIAVEDSPSFQGGIVDNAISVEVPVENPRSFNGPVFVVGFPPAAPDAPPTPTFFTFGKHGILVRNSTFRGQISGNSVLNFTDTESVLVAGSTFLGNISRNTIYNSPSGIRVEGSTFAGDIVGNRITCPDVEGPANTVGVSVDGILLKDNPYFHGDLRNNVVANYSRAGILIFHTTTGTVAGDIVDNTLNQNGAALGVFNTTLLGGLRGNSFSHSLSPDYRAGEIPGAGLITFQNSGDGVDFVNSHVVGSLVDNVAQGNDQLGIGMWYTRFDGDVTGNTIEQNGSFEIAARSRSMGLAIVDSRFTGDIRGNSLSRNGAVGLGVWDSVVVGDIAGNLIQDNTDGLWLIDTTGTTRDTRLTGDIQGNTIRDNLRVGLATWTADVFGDLVANTIEGNNAQPGVVLPPGHDLAGVAFYEDTVWTGDVVHNQLLRNSGEGMLLEKSLLVGDVAWNDVQANWMRGVSVRSDAFVQGTFRGNTFTANGIEGLRIEVATPTPSLRLVDVVDNRFSLNNVGVAREFLAVNSGVGDLHLNLQGNSSTNAVPPGQYDFDLLNVGGGAFTVSPVDVQTVNQGTVGSSDGSVTIP